MYQRSTLWLFCWVLSFACACGGGGSTSSEGACISDAQCKGDRICRSGACVDPEGSQSSAGESGDAGGAGGAGGMSMYTGKVPQGGHGFIDDPELEQACFADCEARLAAGCSMNVGSLDQCLAQCLLIDESTQGYCLDEMTNRYACSASGGYTCVSGYAQPKATCISETTAYSKCSQTIPCRAYCDNLPDTCDDAGADCFSSCTEQQTEFTDAICGIYFNQLLSCWSRNVSCEDGKPAVGTCGPAVAEIADCVGRRNHVCDGFCWAADALGCGSSACVTECKAKADASQCGSYYGNVIDCATGHSRELNLSCEAGVPTVNMTACMSYIQQYDSCMMTQ